ncbi:MAG: hypothetical protein ACRDYA_12735 [Egibacteraceae bacterium]
MNPDGGRRRGEEGHRRTGGASKAPVATFFGGCVPASAEEEELAYRAGRELGLLGFRLHHGGYNGLMEQAAKGAADVDAQVVAVTLRGKGEWGAFNPTSPIRSMRPTWDSVSGTWSSALTSSWLWAGASAAFTS